MHLEGASADARGRTSRPAARTWRAPDVQSPGRRAGGALRRRWPRPKPRHIARSSRRSTRVRKAATSCTASPTRATSWPSRWFAPWPATALRGGGRAIDICGGSGHLTRSLLDLSSPPPVLADLYFSKIWLARRFTAPGCEAVCCDGNAPMPFARGAFRYRDVRRRLHVHLDEAAVRAGDAAADRRSRIRRAPGAVVISHTHNAACLEPVARECRCRRRATAICSRRWSHVSSPKPGSSPMSSRADRSISARRDSPETLDGDPALVVVASRGSGREDVFRPHPLDVVPGAAAASCA